MSVMSGLCRTFRTALTTVPATASRPLMTSPAMASGMTKKKRKEDPRQARIKEERKRTKLQKAIKKLSKKKRIVKPLLELQPAPEVVQQADTVR